MAEKQGPSADKLKALQAAMAKIDKEYGKGAIMKLGDENIENVPVIPTGSLGLNYALGVGGYPKGRIIEIYGPESSGKTTLAIHAMAEVQKAGGIAAIIDAEHAFDRFYAEKLGVNITELLIAQPDSGEQALDIADELIRSAAVDLIVIDSVILIHIRLNGFPLFRINHPRLYINLFHIGVGVGEQKQTAALGFLRADDGLGNGSVCSDVSAFQWHLPFHRS